MNPSQQQLIIRSLMCDRRPLDTNPVYYFRLLWPDGVADLSLLREAGFRLPAHLLDELAHRGTPVGEFVDRSQEPPGVVGLLASGDAAFVVPLRARRAEQWYVPPTLPFTAEALQEVMGRLFHAGGLALARLQPQLFPFRLEESHGWRSEGPSMSVAGLLAVIASAAEQFPPLLAGATAVVQPAGDALLPVNHIRVKLDAFRRELHHGTLLIRGKHCPESSKYDSYFDQVWPIETLAELARLLDDSGLLDPFRKSHPLDGPSFERVVAWIRVLIDRRYRCHEAVDLLDELQRAPLARDVSQAARGKIADLRLDAYRHLGLYDQALHEARRRVQQLDRRPEWTSFEEQVRAAVVYAASLYDPHCFDKMEPILLPWLERVRAECRLVTPEVRTWLGNTLARGRVIAGGDWEGPFLDSLALQRRLDPFQVPRTYCYLMHGYLRHGRLREARQILRRADPDNLHDNRFSRWMLRFLQAELARRGGQIWTDAEMESQSVAHTRLAHPYGFYFQATARQRGRTREDACHRFQRAQQFFLADMGRDDERNIAFFLAEAMALAQAGWQQNAAEWQHALERLRRFAQHRSSRGLKAHYRSVWPSAPSGPSREEAERLLQHIPFF